MDPIEIDNRRVPQLQAAPRAKKNSKLLTLFFISFLLFNILFFSHTALTEWWYDFANTSSKCADDTVESDFSDGSSDIFQNVKYEESPGCDIAGLSKADDIIQGAFALSAIASAVFGSMLLIRLCARLWKKLKRRS